MKIELLNPSPMESKESIMWHNLKLADQTHNYNLVPSIAMAWLKLNPNNNLQDFEKVLRDNKLDTYLYAMPQKTPGRLKLRENDMNMYLYECGFCCQKDALDEIIKIHGTYEKSFNLLKDVGVVYPEDHRGQMQRTERNTMIFLMNCEKKIKIIPVTTIEYILGIHNNHKNVNGKDPDHVLLCKTKTGLPVFTLMHEGRLLSEYGYVIDTNSNLELVKL